MRETQEDNGKSPSIQSIQLANKLASNSRDFLIGQDNVVVNQDSGGSGSLTIHSQANQVNLQHSTLQHDSGKHVGLPHAAELIQPHMTGAHHNVTINQIGLLNPGLLLMQGDININTGH